MASMAPQLRWTPSFGIRIQDSGFRIACGRRRSWRGVEVEMRVPGIIFIVAFFIITSSHPSRTPAKVFMARRAWLASLGLPGS